MNKINKSNLFRKLFYTFIALNILGLIYLKYTNSDILNVWMIKENLYVIKEFFTWVNLIFGLILYILILTIRWLTIFPWTPFLILWILIFPKLFVILSIEIAILLYTIIIYKYSDLLNFKIPAKILKFEKKIKRYEIISIFWLCFIPWISINLLAYFLSIIKVDLKYILIWLISWTIITTSIYIYIVGSAFDLVL